MNNEPAYPFTEMHTHGHAYNQWKGMTLRDYFASKSMQGFLGRPNLPVSVSDDELAAACYEMADAMLKARNK